MTKKFFSIVLSLVLLIGLLPVMNVSAAGETIYFEDDFENYNPTDVFYNSAGTANVKDKSGITKWTAANALKAEMVTMNGYDGEPTQALKLTMVTDDGSMGGNERFTLKTDQTAATTGIQVIEAKFYTPAENSIFRYSFGVIRKYAAGFDLDKDANDIGTYFKAGTWLKATIVVNLDTDETIVYVNDTVASYNKYKITAASAFPTRLGIAQADAGDYLIMDDIKMYHSPAATQASSTLDGKTSVSARVAPAVSFTEKLLNTTLNDDGIISAEKNVTFVKTVDQSDNVTINEIKVSKDGKTLEIVPAKDLEKGTNYTVTVKNLKDMYGQDIEDYTFSFTTAEDYNLKTTTPVFTKVDLVNPKVEAQNIQNLENGHINAACTLTSEAATDTQVMMVAVLKDDDDIKYMQFDTVTVPANGSFTYNAGFKVDNYLSQKIEVFAWDSLYGMTPLVSKYSISASGIAEVSFDD